MLDLKNSGLATLNDAPCPARATVIVTGVARSGTSMIGAALHELGLPLGGRFDRVVFEDQELGKAIGAQDHGLFKSLVRQRNSSFDKWAFKRPEVQPHLAKILSLLRAPRVILTFRDPVAIARRNEVSMNFDFREMLQDAARKTNALASFVGNTSAPVLLVSYEKAIQQPERLVRSLSEFCGLDAPEQALAAAVEVVQPEPEAYLEVTRVRHIGFFDGIREGKAIGWACLTPAMKPCDVEVVADGAVVNSGVSNLPRGDLGRIGDVAFSIEVGDRRPDQLEVRVANTTFVLPRSGQKT